MNPLIQDRWGHLRPLIALSCSLLQLAPNLHITVVQVGSMKDKVDAEVQRYGLTEEQKSRLISINFGDRLVDGSGLLPPLEALNIVFVRFQFHRSSASLPNSGATIDSFSKIYPLLLSSSPIPDSLSPNSVTLPSDLRPPTLLILDMTIAAACGPVAIAAEKAYEAKPTTKLSFMPFNSACVAWVYFNTSFEKAISKTMTEVEGGRDLKESYDEASQAPTDSS